MIKNRNNTLLLEAKHFMTKREKQLKNQLIKLLKDDGKGNRHAKYADRLSKFDINIVSLKADPEFTAAISFDEGIIFVGEGFLVDPETFHQLSVLMRHELAHNLMMHQLRMIKKLGNERWEGFATSHSLHDLLNTIMDDEISNKKYSKADKEIVRNMWLNGRLISGLVTEDHRESWLDLTLEEMFEKIEEEIGAAHSEILSGKGYNISNKNGDIDPIKASIANTLQYTNINQESIIKGDLKAFIEKGCYIPGEKSWYQLAPNYRAIIEKIYNSLTEDAIANDALELLLKDIAKSSPTQVLSLTHPTTNQLIVKLRNPEEKSIAMNTLKKFRSEYDEWYNKVFDAVQKLNISAYDLRDLARDLKD